MLETEVAFLDQIEQLHTGRHGVAPGHRHHEAKVGADEPVLGDRGVGDRTVEFGAGLAGLFTETGLVALLDDLGQLTLFFRGEQRDEPYFVEILTY